MPLLLLIGLAGAGVVAYGASQSTSGIDNALTIIGIGIATGIVVYVVLKK